MKYYFIYLLLLLSVADVFAENGDTIMYRRRIEGNVCLGVNVNKFRVGHNSSGQDNRTGINLRFGINFPLNNNVGIETGIGIEQKGSVKDEYGEKLNLCYIQIPALASYRFFPEKKIHMDIAFGPYAAFGVDANPFSIAGDTFVDEDYSWVYDDNSAQFADFVEKFDCGIIGNISISIMRLRLDFRYEYGLVNISKIKGTDIRNRGWSISAGYIITL